MKKIKYLLKTFIRKKTTQHLKYTIVLIPILSIICMFATIVTLPAINQKIFFNNADYQQLSFFNDKETDTFLAQGGILADFQNSNYYVSNIMLSDKKNKEIKSITQKNLYESLNNDNYDICIGLSHNIISNLKLKLGDVAVVVCNDSLGEIIEIKGVITEIYNPFYFNLESNSFDESYGLCVIYSSDLDPKELQGMYISTTEINDNFTYTKTEQKNVVKSTSMLDLFTSALIPFLAIVLLILVNYSNLKHIISLHQRNISVFLVLGESVKIVFISFFVFLMLMNLISVVGAIMLYKYLIYDIWLNQVVPLPVIVIVFLSMILICSFCTFIGLNTQYKKMNENSLLSILYERMSL